MTKIVLDIVLIILFTAIAGLQIYIIHKIKKLKKYYKQFNKSEQNFINSIEKARQSLMLVNSQAVDIMPELKLSIDKAESIIQDFSFVMARANRKLDQLQNVSSNSVDDKPSSLNNDNTKSVKSISSGVYSTESTSTEKDFLSSAKDLSIEKVDPLMARLEKLEKEEMSKEQYQSSKLSTQEELIEKALKEIL